MRLWGSVGLTVAFGLGSLLAACGKATRDGATSAEATASTAGLGSGGLGTGGQGTGGDVEVAAGGAGSGTGGAGGAGATGGSAGAPSCDLPTVPRAPLRRLTRFEYDNTVTALLGDEGVTVDSLPSDARSNDVDQMPMSSDLVRGYHELAHQFALDALEGESLLEDLNGCDPSLDGEAVCAEQFVERFLKRAFRRPVESDDVDDLLEVFATGQQLGGDFDSGVRAVVEVALQSPEFLYRVEFGEAVDEPAVQDLGRPAPHEMASRLSYLLWGAPPDDELMLAAGEGRLSSLEAIAAQATRMLDDDRARELVRYFYFQLLRLHDVDLSSLAEENQGFTPELGQLFFEETRRFVDEVTWQGRGDLATLLTAPFSFLNGTLAEFHGIDAVSGDGFERVDLDPERRAGVLTQPSVLSSTSRATLGRVTLRGRLLLEQLLCVQLPEPPEVHSEAFLADPPAEPTRSIYEANLVDPTCVACHQLTDSLGFAFLNYDAVGRWQDSEYGQTIDASAEVDVGDVSGAYIGARELAEALAASEDVRNCFINKWMVFAYGREETPDDACTRQALEESFDASGGVVRDLLVALTQTDAFLYRPVVEP